MLLSNLPQPSFFYAGRIKPMMCWSWSLTSQWQDYIQWIHWRSIDLTSGRWYGRTWPCTGSTLDNLVKPPGYEFNIQNCSMDDLMISLRGELSSRYPTWVDPTFLLPLIPLLKAVLTRQRFQNLSVVLPGCNGTVDDHVKLGLFWWNVHAGTCKYMQHMAAHAWFSDICLYVHVREPKNVGTDLMASAAAGLQTYVPMCQWHILGAAGTSGLPAGTFHSEPQCSKAILVIFHKWHMISRNMTKFAVQNFKGAHDPAQTWGVLQSSGHPHFCS